MTEINTITVRYSYFILELHSVANQCTEILSTVCKKNCGNVIISQNDCEI